MVRSEVLRAVSAPLRRRCAIYTRKSSEEGLDQEFNSLDAQREACAAFVSSQAGLGWKLIAESYDDGGLSGGTMERPALQRLLQDIRERKIDVVVVYKIDRLTRSLMDFARIVEIFDGHGVSFVSVTQQFNTTTSMGRLTLNVLLSFAQFEREVTAERIRDKIAASKRKGMWMGGRVPFGYRTQERKLIIEESAAEEVRRLFNRYLQLRSVPALAEEINRAQIAAATVSPDAPADGEMKDGIKPPITRPGRLYHLLSNPIYIGKIRHHRELYHGEHAPIVDRETFDRVQALLAQQAPRRGGFTVSQDNHLLNGLLFDDAGDRMSPAHATKKGKRYRYYISSRLKSTKRNANEGWRIPAVEIEAAVMHQLRVVLADQAALSRWIIEHASHRPVEAAMHHAEEFQRQLGQPSSRQEIAKILRIVFCKITLGTDRLQFAIDATAVADWLTSRNAEARQKPSPARDETSRDRQGRNVVVDLPIALKRRGVEARIIVEGNLQREREPDKALVNLIARAHLYLRALTDGAGRNIQDTATQFGVHRADVSRILPLAFLAPKIVEAILNGRQPADLSARQLARHIDLPIDWAEQIERLPV